MAISNDGTASAAASARSLSSRPDTSTNDNETSNIARPGRKLHGRAFYESIGSPKFILAPMVDQSEFVRLFQALPRHASFTDMVGITGMAYAHPLIHDTYFEFQPSRIYPHASLTNVQRDL